MTLSLIVAMTDERIIGHGNKLPWHLSDDLKRFKKITMGHSIVMGRKTFESIGKPLPGRRNIVVSRKTDYHPAGVEVVNGLDRALAATKNEPEVFVIGGGEIFREALSKAQRIYLTQIHHPFPGDVRFPEFDLSDGWVISERTDLWEAGVSPFSYSFMILTKT